MAPHLEEALAALQASKAGNRWIAGLLRNLPDVKRVEEILTGQDDG